MTLHGLYELHEYPVTRRPRPDDLGAWRRERRRHKKRSERLLRALFVALFLIGAAGGYLIAAPPRW